MKKKTNTNSTLSILLKKGYPLGAQIADVASMIKEACPNLFQKTDPYPTVRMIEFKEDKITYEITEGKSSRAKVGCV